MHKYKVLDLFAGGGGFSTGFHMAHVLGNTFEVVKAVEINEEACMTLETHLGKERVLKGDITDPKIKQQIVLQCRGVVDVIIGGPPCQTYSLVGPSRSGKAEMREALKTDPRNTLFKHFFELVGAIKPRFVVFENVEGITSKELDSENELNDHQRLAIDVICDELESLGYCTYLQDKVLARYQVLDAYEFGVPQHRRRVIIIANRHGELNVSPRTVAQTSVKNLRGAIGDLPVVLPRMNLDIDLKNFDLVLKNLSFIMGEFIKTINDIERHSPNHAEVQSSEFTDLRDYVNLHGHQVMNRKYKRNEVLVEFLKGYNAKLESYEALYEQNYKTMHTSRVHNFRDVAIFTLMQQGTSSAQFIKTDSPVYDPLLDDLYPYDRTKHLDTYVKHAWRKPSNTILSHLERDGLKFIHPTEPRTFTPYEAAMIQSFPLEYAFGGGRNAQYRQIGNAVPPLLAKAIGEAVLSMLEKIDVTSNAGVLLGS